MKLLYMIGGFVTVFVGFVLAEKGFAMFSAEQYAKAMDEEEALRHAAADGRVEIVKPADKETKAE